VSGHLSEEDLILRHYGETAGTQDAAMHLAECAECRARLDALAADLRAFGEDAVPERGDDYGAEVWARVEPRLEEKRVLSFRRFLAPAALAASLVLAFLVGRHSRGPEAQPTPAPLVREVVRERILLVAVGDHLDRSRLVLLELASAADAKGPVDITSEQQRAANLVANSRLYRQTAARAGEAKVASVLDDLERILVEVANGPSRLTPAELGEIRKRIEDGGLLFKVKILGSQVRQRERESQKDRTVS
jgi:hypothetical protein